jgi:glycosyltransferase involved in cell wall biosynthesis
LIVLDDHSTDATEQVVRNFKGMPCEWVRNPHNAGLFGNCNRALEYAPETDYLHILHQDDVIEPAFYKTLTDTLADCNGFGMAFCLDERIDENNQRLSISGSADGRIRRLSTDEFLRRKAEISNQAFSATLLKTSRRKAPCRFRTDMPILGDMVYWADWGRHCEQIVQVNLPLTKYRWHGANATTNLAPSIQSLILDEWRTMQMVEGMRARKTELVRWWKLKGLFAVRSGIKARRLRQRGNHPYSREIVRVARPISGIPLWLAGQVLVHLRDLFVYTILRRPQHPKNIYG